MAGEGGGALVCLTQIRFLIRQSASILLGNLHHLAWYSSLVNGFSQETKTIMNVI